MKPGYIYELKLENVKSAEGRPLAHELICYTLNKLKTQDVSEGAKYSVLVEPQP